MGKRVLIISSSPRKGGNSDTLCDQFMKGAEEAGNQVYKIRLAEMKIDYCSACYACKKTGHCVKQDDMAQVVDKMRNADVIVLATPVYFYTMCAQMKTMIDRTLGGAQQSGLENKEFYLIATAADGKSAMERTADAEAQNNGGESAEQNAAGTEESAAGENSAVESEAGNAAGTGGGNILVAYFSVMETDGVDTVAGASRVAVNGEVLGNNQYIAQIIQEQVGGDLFSVETVQEYPTTHEPLLEFAYEEKADNARPELATHIENPDSYDVIFLGFPNWNADLPMPLYTFLEEYDFGGKTIIPFTTHGGSGFSATIQTIAGLQPEAEVISEGLSISRSSVAGAESEVIDWINGLGLSN